MKWNFFDLEELQVVKIIERSTIFRLDGDLASDKMAEVNLVKGKYHCVNLLGAHADGSFDAEEIAATHFIVRGTWCFIKKVSKMILRKRIINTLKC